MKMKALVLDVDGVLTDGSVLLGPHGAEWKRYSFLDVMGVSLAWKGGLTVGLISGEDIPGHVLVKFGVYDATRECKDKAEALRAFAARNHFALEEICFMGDDVNDLGAMKLAGLSMAPSSAHSSVREVAHFVTEASGGNGAVREAVDRLLGMTTEAGE